MKEEKSTKEMLKDFDVSNAKITALEDGSIMMNRVNIGFRNDKEEAERFIASLNDNVIKIIATFISEGENIKVHYTNSDNERTKFVIDKCIFPNGLLYTEKDDTLYPVVDFSIELDKLGETPESAIG